MLIKTKFETMISLHILLIILNQTNIASRISCPLTSIHVEQQWAKYVAEGEEFSALLPEAPSMAFKLRPKKEVTSRYLGRIYGAYGEGIVYVITSENNPNRSEKLETFVEEFKRHLPRMQSGGKIVSSDISFDQELLLNGFPGKRYHIRLLNKADGIVDFYSTKHHVYIVEVVSRDINHPSVERFLQSLTLDERLMSSDAVKRSNSNLKSTNSSGLGSPALNQADDNQVYSGRDVTDRVLIVSKPEPLYTNEARSNRISGTVVLTGVFAESGKFINIKVVKGLKGGLTESAVEAAKNMKFIPATKDGKYVSQRVQVEYQFDLY